MQAHLKYEPALDGLRALAVLIVVACHLIPSAKLNGWVGVNLFFILSGYLITRLLMKELNQTGTIQLCRFYLRRALRLMPPLWTLLLVLLPLILMGHHRPAQLWSWSMAATYLMNFNRAFDWGSDYGLGHTWSLAAEEQFYWLWPAILLLGARKWPKLTVGALFIGVTAWRLYLSYHGASIERIYNGLDTNSDAILAGCLLGLITIPEKLRTTISTLWPLWLAITLYDAAFVDGSPASFTLFCLVGAAAVISSGGPLFGKLLSTRPMIFTGKISYALYLWHFPLIVFLNADYHFTGWRVLIPAVLAYVIAAISYFTVEAWARRAKSSLPASGRLSPAWSGR